MLLIASAYYYMNRADPDCGTTFSWVDPRDRAVGGLARRLGDHRRRHHRDGEPRADRRRSTRFLLFGWHERRRLDVAVIVVGVVWIAVMTWICYVGIELSARTQYFLLTAEILTLGPVRRRRAGEGLRRRRAADARSIPTSSWFNPFAIDVDQRSVAVSCSAIFIYWGWDSAVTVNEESEDPAEGPGKAAVLATVILVLHLRRRLGRGAGLRRAGAASSDNSGRRPERARRTRSSARPGQAR